MVADLAFLTLKTTPANDAADAGVEEGRASVHHPVGESRPAVALDPCQDVEAPGAGRG